MTDSQIKNNLLSFKQALNLMLKSDFLIHDKNLKSSSNFEFFDLHHTIMNLKELIRNLGEVRRTAHGKVYLYIENRYLKSVSNLILNNLEHLKERVFIVNSARDIIKSSSEFSIFVIFGSVNKKFITEILTNNFFIIHTINENTFQPASGIYNICNKVSHINKLLFLFSVMDQVLKTRIINNA